jgi:hypothetical protein
MKLSIITLCVLTTFAVADNRWKLEIVSPENKNKILKLEKSELKVPIGDSRWECKVTAPAKGTDLETRAIRCSRSSGKDKNFELDSVSTNLSCKNNYPKLANLHIYEAPKDRATQLFLYCNMD